MNRVLKINGIVLLNIALIFLSLKLYYGYTDKIIKITYTPYGLEGMITIPLAFIGLMLIISNKKFRSLGIGASALFISATIFLVFYFNKNLSPKGEYEMLMVRKATWTDEGFFLNIDFNRWYNATPVTQDKCLKIDSVQVRIDPGLFGMGTMTNDIKIPLGINCEHINIDSSNQKISHLEIAHELAGKRCFNGAIFHYTRCIALDSLDNIPFYHRGLMYMVLNEYNKALIDFSTAAILKYGNLSDSEIKALDNQERTGPAIELMEKIKNHQLDNISELVNNIFNINDFDTYQQRIKFCVEQIENE